MGRFLTPLSKNGKLVKTVPITNGGTSATTAPLALSNLGGIVDSETNVPDGVVKLDATGHIPIGLIDPSVLREISVKGPIQMKMNSTKTFQITDFDSFIDVDITTDLGSGTAVLNNDIITYTAPSSIGTYGFYRNGKLFPIDVTSNNYLQTNLLVPFGDALNVPYGAQAGTYEPNTSFDIDYLGQSLVVNYTDYNNPGNMATYTYEKIGGIWTQKQAFAYTNFTSATGSIAISGDGNVFSSKGRDISNSYVITIFRKIAGSWVLENEIPDVLSLYSGHSLSYDGAVLAYYNYDYRTLSIYEYVSGTWTLLFTYIDPDIPDIGWSAGIIKNVAVSYNGTYVAYCNCFNQKVHVFKKELGVWNHQQTILNVDELGNPHTAASVKFSKNNLMLIAGVRSCVLYNLNSNTWVLNYDLANIEYSPGNKLYQHSWFYTFTPSSISKDTEDLIIAGNFTLAFINGLWTVTSTTTDYGIIDGTSVANIELNGDGTSYFIVQRGDPLSGIAVFE